MQVYVLSMGTANMGCVIFGVWKSKDVAISQRIQLIKDGYQNVRITQHHL